MNVSLKKLTDALRSLQGQIDALGGGSGGVQSVVAGSGIDVDDSDPANPVVSATGDVSLTSIPMAQVLVPYGVAKNYVTTGSQCLPAYSSHTTADADPLFASVSQLALFRGNDGDDTSAQLGSSRLSVIAGTFAINTAEARISSGCLKFNSTRLQNGTPVCVGTGDFCVEGFFKLTSTSGSPVLLDGRASGAGTGPEIYVNASGVAYFSSSVRIQGPMPSTNTWFHVAAERYNGTTTLYFNGVSAGSFTDSTSYPSGSFVTLGFNVGNSTYTQGYVDSIRITQAARYKGAFTPTATEFPNH